jgi:hypothetical protein
MAKALAVLVKLGSWESSRACGSPSMTIEGLVIGPIRSDWLRYRSSDYDP